MKDSIKDFLGTIFVFAEIIGFILVIGFAGSIDQNLMTIKDGIIRIIICGGAMAVIGLGLYLLCRGDEREF